MGTKRKEGHRAQDTWPGGIPPESVQTPRGGARGWAPEKGCDSLRQPGVLPDVPGDPGHSWGAGGQQDTADNPPPTLPGPCGAQALPAAAPPPPPRPPSQLQSLRLRKTCGLPSWCPCVFGEEEDIFVLPPESVLAWLGGVGYRHFIWVRVGAAEHPEQRPQPILGSVPSSRG